MAKIRYEKQRVEYNLKAGWIRTRDTIETKAEIVRDITTATATKMTKENSSTFV